MKPADAIRAARLVRLRKEMIEWLETCENEKKKGKAEVRAEDLYFETEDGKGTSYEKLEVPLDLMRDAFQFLKDRAETELKKLGVEVEE